MDHKVPKSRVLVARALTGLWILFTYWAFTAFFHAAGYSWFYSVTAPIAYAALGYVVSIVFMTAMGLPFPWEDKKDRDLR